MSKITAFFLLVSLVIYSGGNFIVYKLRLNEIRNEMKDFISSHPDDPGSIHFSFAIKNHQVSASSFTWEEDGEEFRFNNKMYDVVRIQYYADYVDITCMKDESEDQLIAAFTNWQKQHAGRKSTTLSLFKIFQGYFTAETIFNIGPAVVGVPMLVPHD